MNGLAALLQKSELADYEKTYQMPGLLNIKSAIQKQGIPLSNSRDGASTILFLEISDNLFPGGAREVLNFLKSAALTVHKNLSMDDNYFEEIGLFLWAVYSQLASLDVKRRREKMSPFLGQRGKELKKHLTPHMKDVADSLDKLLNECEKRIKFQIGEEVWNKLKNFVRENVKSTFTINTANSGSKIKSTEDPKQNAFEVKSILELFDSIRKDMLVIKEKILNDKKSRIEGIPQTDKGAELWFGSECLDSYHRSHNIHRKVLAKLSGKMLDPEQLNLSPGELGFDFKVNDNRTLGML